MGSALIVVIGIVLALAGAILYVLAGRQIRQDARTEYDLGERSRMPPELATATLVVSEKNLGATVAGCRIPVRPDQVYRTLEGRVVTVETKTRARMATYQSDVIEMSLQALAMEDLYPGQVAPYGYVRVIIRRQGGGTAPPKYVRVNLMSRDEIEALYWRYQGIVDGSIKPTCNPSRAACASCSHRAVCPAAL